MKECSKLICFSLKPFLLKEIMEPHVRWLKRRFLMSRMFEKIVRLCFLLWSDLGSVRSSLSSERVLLISSEPLKAIEVGLDALSSLGFQIPFDEAPAAQLAEELKSQISRDRAVIAV